LESIAESLVQANGMVIARIDGEMTEHAALVQIGEERRIEVSSEALAAVSFGHKEFVHPVVPVRTREGDDGPHDIPVRARAVDDGMLNPEAPDMLTVRDELGVAILSPGDAVECGNGEKVRWFGAGNRIRCQQPPPSIVRLQEDANKRLPWRVYEKTAAASSMRATTFT